MKPLLFATVFLSAACASKPVQTVVRIDSKPSGRTLNSGETRAVRHPETIKAYPLGRYVEPNRRNIMHEAHTIYRVESTPKWNLAKPSSPVLTKTRSSPVADLSRNELLVELHRQREATKAVMQSGQTVSTKLTELATSLQKNQQVLAEQNVVIHRELKATQDRLETLERHAEERTTSGTDASPPPDDEPW